MSKTTRRNSDANLQRKNRILGCQQCKGTPETAETNLQGLRTTYCVNCMEVINYTNEKVPVQTAETVAKNIEDESKNKVQDVINFDYLKGYKPNSL